MAGYPVNQPEFPALGSRRVVYGGKSRLKPKRRTSNTTQTDVRNAALNGQLQSQRLGGEIASGAARERQSFIEAETAKDRANQAAGRAVNLYGTIAQSGERHAPWVEQAAQAALAGGTGEQKPPPTYASALPNTNVTFANRHGEMPTGPRPMSRQDQNMQAMGIRVGTGDEMADIRAKNIEIYRNMAMRDDAMRARHAAEDAAGQTPTIPMQLPGGGIYQHPTRGVLRPGQQAQFEQALTMGYSPAVEPTAQQMLPQRIQPYSEADAASINRDQAGMGLQGRVQPGLPMMVNGERAPTFLPSGAQPTPPQPVSIQEAEGIAEQAQWNRRAAASRPDPFKLSPETASTQPPILNDPLYTRRSGVGATIGAPTVQPGAPQTPTGAPGAGMTPLTPGMSTKEQERAIAANAELRAQQAHDLSVEQTNKAMADVDEAKRDVKSEKAFGNIQTLATSLGADTWKSDQDVASMKQLRTNVDAYLRGGKTPQEVKDRAQEILNDAATMNALRKAALDTSLMQGMASTLGSFGGRITNPFRPTGTGPMADTHRTIGDYTGTAKGIILRLNAAAERGR